MGIDNDDRHLSDLTSVVRAIVGEDEDVIGSSQRGVHMSLMIHLETVLADFRRVMIVPYVRALLAPQIDRTCPCWFNIVADTGRSAAPSAAGPGRASQGSTVYIRADRRTGATATTSH